MTYDDLRAEAIRVLRQNWTGRNTVPSRTLYPHQWSWDSAFIAIGLRHVAPAYARLELQSLFEAQWADGRIPHIAFSPSVPRDAYFPGPDFWRAFAPSGTETSGIIQPPVHALAAWLVHSASPSLDFLRQAYPRLAAWHRYLHDRRDLGGRGLVAVIHPWESGMDNSPAWDAGLSRVEAAPPESFTRRDTDHARKEDRPTDVDYGRYVRLAATYRDHAYDDARTPFEFAVEDPGFNALLVASEYALADIALAIGNDPAPHRDAAERLTTALGALFSTAGIFRPYDVLSGELVAIDGVAGLLPLIAPGLPQADDLLATLRGPRFRLGEVHLVPSYALTGPGFEPGRYWRGPSWFNTAWLVHRALPAADANALRADFLRLAAETRFAEYIDPLTGEPHGASDFSWTAALALDLLTVS